MMKNVFLMLSRWYLTHLNFSRYVRDLIMWPIATRILGTSYDGITILKNGMRMGADLNDVLGRMIVFYGPSQKYLWEPKTEQLIELLVAHAESAFIAGAHIGYLALFTRNAMKKKNARVHAFEPVRYLFEICKRNFRLNEKRGGLFIHRCALSDRSGDCYIKVDALTSHIVDHRAGEGVEAVSAVSVDSYVRRNGVESIDFMLLDVEGHEFNVFNGMHEIFSRGFPNDIIFEENRGLKHRPAQFEVIADFFRSRGYCLYLIKDNYKLALHERNIRPVRLYPLSAAPLFESENHFNVLATRRERSELIHMGIEIQP